MIKVSWTEMKDFVDTRSLSLQYVETSNAYYIVAIDGPFEVRLSMGKTTPPSSDQTDFEDNYKAEGNKSFTDSNNIPLSRGKVTQSGWHYQEHGIEITTALNDGYYNRDRTGADLGYLTYTMCDSSDLVTQVEALAVKTVITWMPAHDMEVIGAKLSQGTVPSGDLRVWVTAVPDYGGTAFLEGGINLKHMGTGSVFNINGRSSKKFLYNDPVPNTNKFQITLLHDQGAQHTIQAIVEMYKA